jgi:hypothetical protein
MMASKNKPTWRLNLRSSYPRVRRSLQEFQFAMNSKEEKRADLQDRRKRLQYVNDAGCLGQDRRRANLCSVPLSGAADHLVILSAKKSDG